MRALSWCRIDNTKRLIVRLLPKTSITRQAERKDFNISVILAIFSVTLIALSLYGVIVPLKLAAHVQRFLNKFEVGGAAVIRLFLAVVLWRCAPVSHTPAAFKVLAVIMLATAIALLIVGRARLQKLIDWVTTWPPIAIRLQCLAGVAFGAFLLWSVSAALGAV